MKSSFTLILIGLIFLSIESKAQQDAGVIDQKKHKIVIQFSANDPLSQNSVIGQVKNIRTAWPNAEVEVVCHGPGLEMLVATQSKAAKAIAEWSALGVTFAACNNTMQKRNVKKEDLLPAVQVVPSAMIELVLKQEAGWAYAKGGH